MHEPYLIGPADSLCPLCLCRTHRAGCPEADEAEPPMANTEHSLHVNEPIIVRSSHHPAPQSRIDPFAVVSVVAGANTVSFFLDSPSAIIDLGHRIADAGSRLIREAQDAEAPRVQCPECRRLIRVDAGGLIPVHATERDGNRPCTASLEPLPSALTPADAAEIDAC